MKKTAYYLVFVIFTGIGGWYFSYLSDLEARSFNNWYQLGQFLITVILALLFMLPDIIEKVQKYKELILNKGLLIVSLIFIIAIFLSVRIQLLTWLNDAVLHLFLFADVVTLIHSFGMEEKQMSRS